MTTRSILKQWFSRGKKPTAAQFAEWIDSFWHKGEDKIEIDNINALPQTLSNKSDVGHTHTLAEITDYGGGDKEIINAYVASDSTELDAFAKVAGMYYILLDTHILFLCGFDESSEEYHLTEVNPDGNVIYSAYDADNTLHIYLFNVLTMQFQDVTDQKVENTIYVRNLTTALDGYTERGIYNVCHTNANMAGGTSDTTYFTFTIAQAGKTITQTLSNHDGYRTRSKSEDADWSEWEIHTYSTDGHNHDGAYSAIGHTHQQEEIDGLTEALENKANTGHTHTIEAVEGLADALNEKSDVNHNHDNDYAPIEHTHEQYLTHHQDISGKQDKTDNTLLTSVKTIIGAINELWNKFTDYIKGIQHVTYAQLKTLRDDGALVPGQWYRIIDYVTTVANDPEARSAGHVFDVLVFATSENTLSEEAKAIKSTRDTEGYFANSNLDAWKIWYCLDNDATRFAWADEENGTGVIYRMIDEWQNDCPYDFKNVQFKRYKVTPTTPIPEDGSNRLLSDLDGLYLGYNGYMQSLEFVDENDNIWLYTCSQLNNDGSIEDHSVLEVLISQNEEHYKATKHCENNIIKPYSAMVIIDETRCAVQALNNIVILSGFDDNDGYPKSGELRNNVFDLDCCSTTLFGFPENNHFGTECINNIINGYNNTFGYSCSYNTFGNYCYSNSFGNDCYSNTFGNYFGSNTFGNGCEWNTFGNGCEWNTFGNYCDSNTFGNGCEWNTFGNYCYWNTFGNYCGVNTFGNSCSENTLGNLFQNNTFGNYCYSNSFGNYVRQLTIFDDVQYVSITGTESNSTYVQNAQILNGTSGSNESNMLQISFQENAKYCQVAGLKSDGELRIWNPADGV